MRKREMNELSNPVEYAIARGMREGMETHRQLKAYIILRAKRLLQSGALHVCDASFSLVLQKDSDQLDTVIEVQQRHEFEGITRIRTAIADAALAALEDYPDGLLEDVIRFQRIFLAYFGDEAVLRSNGKQIIIQLSSDSEISIHEVEMFMKLEQFRRLKYRIVRDASGKEHA